MDSEASYGWHAHHVYNRALREPGEHSFLRDGVWFTVLKPDNFDQSGLVFWNALKVFTTSVKQEFYLIELSEHARWGAGPTLHLDTVRDGVTLSVVGEGGKFVREIAVFPWAVTRGYGWWQNGEKMENWRKGQLAKHDWTIDDAARPRRRDVPGLFDRRLAHDPLHAAQWDPGLRRDPSQLLASLSQHLHPMSGHGSDHPPLPPDAAGPPQSFGTARYRSPSRGQNFRNSWGQNFRNP